jgi:hypothetical protein
VRPTRPAVLVALALLAAGGGYLVLSVVRPLLPAVPFTLPAGLLVVAAAVLAAARALRRRLDGAPGTRPVEPLGAARMAALAKACSHGGMVLSGAYAAVAVHLLVSTESAPRRMDALAAGLSALGALAVVAAGLLLERVCRVPPSDDTESPPPAPSA